MIECVLTDDLQRTGNANGFQTGAVEKGFFCNDVDLIGNVDCPQRSTTAECTFTNGRKCIGQGDAGKIGAVCEAVLTEGYNSLAGNLAGNHKFAAAGIAGCIKVQHTIANTETIGSGWCRVAVSCSCKEQRDTGNGHNDQDQQRNPEGTFFRLGPVQWCTAQIAKIVVILAKGLTVRAIHGLHLTVTPSYHISL